MINKGRGIGLALGLMVLVGVVLLGLRGSGNDSGKVEPGHGTGSPVTPTIAIGTCATERGVLGSTTCNLSMAQVAKFADLPIAASAKDFTATYEGFQDWNLRASFLLPLDQASVYTALPNYPGATVDGPETEGLRGDAGEYRRLKLETVDGLLKVSVSVFTT
jgi:hypothetical protein